MEIQDYVKVVRRRLWVPLLVPVLAAALTVGLIARQPAQYQARATVVVPALSARGYSTSAVVQYVSTYKDVLVSKPVLDQVAKDTGIKPSVLAKGLVADTQTASSNIIMVTYTGDKKAEASTVVQAAALDALDALIAPQLSAAQTQLSATQSSLDDANKGLSDFTIKTGILMPDEEYRTKSSELSQLMVQLQQAQLAGDGPRSSGLQTIIASRQKEIADLAPTVTEYQSLLDAKRSAQQANTQATLALATVNAEITSNHAPGSVTVENLGRISKVPTMIRFGTIAYAVTLVLSVGLLILLELVGPLPLRRRVGAREAAVAQPAFATAASTESTNS